MSSCRRTGLPIGPRLLELKQERRLVLHLESRVLDPEPLPQELLEAPASLVTVGVAGDADVRRERREPGRDFPDVKVVDLDDARGARERLADRRRVDPGGGGPPEHPPPRPQ